MSRTDPLFETWRDTARRYLRDGVDPGKVYWSTEREAQLGLFSTTVAQSAPASAKGSPSTAGAGGTQMQGAARSGGQLAARSDEPSIQLPRALVQAMPAVAAHVDPRRWDTMYRLMWRIRHGEPHLLSMSVDPDVAHFVTMLQAVRRDIHKMHAFVRFKKKPDGQFVAWYRPDHRIFRLAVPHFVRRYPNMLWSIHSRNESAHWDGKKLRFGEGCERSAVAQDDGTEDLWGIYYGAIFNPARLKLAAMRREMPVRYWSVMPETRHIARLVRESGRRVRAFHAAQPRSAREFLPAEDADWEGLRQAALGCKACDFCAQATQTVFGAGHVKARMFFVGEQPGDEEDTRGEPFVGPAGRLFNGALQEAGIDRASVYVTNAVKHFKWTPRGKKRLHQRPAARDIAACKPWLARELELVRPEVVVCLGATAAQAVFGRVTRVQEARGQKWHTGASEQTYVTTHPAHILRLGDEKEQAAAYAQFVTELREADRSVGSSAP